MAIVVAVLYFGLVELMLLDSARELGEARRFRARIIAETLAENAAELAAQQIITREATVPFNIDTEQGTMIGKMTKSGSAVANERTFEIHGEGVSAGITESRARVTLRGVVTGNQVKIRYVFHQ
jgi:tetrahydrodipicolinate N-succinyltransferase